MALGTATLDFGATATDAANVLVTGLTGLAVGTHKEAFIQADDSIGGGSGNTAQAHALLAFSGRFSCEYVSATSMRIYCDLLFALASGQFTVHWVTSG